MATTNVNKTYFIFIHRFISVSYIFIYISYLSIPHSKVQTYSNRFVLFWLLPRVLNSVPVSNMKGLWFLCVTFVFFLSLKCRQVCGHNFDAGELGPSTIVGSAAYNMFVIIGLCVWVIPNDESRHIKHLRVFFITAFWSIFAYIWLYLILAVISPGIVEVCFPLTAYKCVSNKSSE